MGIILSKPEVYFPETIITNSDLERLVETNDEWITERSGIKERRFSFNKNVREMGDIAAGKVLDANIVVGEEIDGVVFATNWHDENKEFPCHAGYVADKIGAGSVVGKIRADGSSVIKSRSVSIFDIGAGCTGLVYALTMAHDNMLADPNLNKFLVLGGERLTDMTDYSDRNTCVLFGDGVGAYLLERSKSEEGIINNYLGGEPDVGDTGWPFGFLSLERKIGVKLRALDVEQFELFGETRRFATERVEIILL